MTDSFIASDFSEDVEMTAESEAGVNVCTDTDRMEHMRVLLADLRTSIETQRHLIDVSRTLLKRS